jgi:DNA-binding transcriptional regulator YiaG
MKAKMFEELLESVREGGAILRGQRKPSRRFELQSSAIRAIRERTSLSQSEFARLMGVSVKTLQNWSRTAAIQPSHTWPCGRFTRHNNAVASYHSPAVARVPPRQPGVAAPHHPCSRLNITWALAAWSPRPCAPRASSTHPAAPSVAWAAT